MTSESAQQPKGVGESGIALPPRSRRAFASSSSNSPKRTRNGLESSGGPAMHRVRRSTLRGNGAHSGAGVAVRIVPSAAAWTLLAFHRIGRTSAIERVCLCQMLFMKTMAYGLKFEWTITLGHTVTTNIPLRPSPLRKSSKRDSDLSLPAPTPVGILSRMTVANRISQPGWTGNVEALWTMKAVRRASPVGPIGHRSMAASVRIVGSLCGSSTCASHRPSLWGFAP